MCSSHRAWQLAILGWIASSSPPLLSWLLRRAVVLAIVWATATRPLQPLMRQSP